MDNDISFKRSFLFITFFLVGYVTLFTATLPDGFELSAQDFNSEDEILSNINQTLLSLIPLMIQEVENTNATDIPIKQVMEATPSNVTALQNILNNKTDQNVSDNVSSTFTPTSSSSSSSSSSSNTTIPTANTSTPTDLIPVVVNLTQNTNATDIGIMRIINATPDLNSLESNIYNSE